ncbi:ANTAR domain-containing response regulator [Paenibacillus gorillae]|uniref:ANTAR domain-containing response regulator n=1 Tax=Paenibacillus gorillae TaxID=1243662 RepID=UPI0004B01CD1|nr:ANTAR domain-containing protein [Paenibacillus gorillae]
MRSILVISNRTAPAEPTVESELTLSPGYVLEEHGYSVSHADREDTAKQKVDHTDAVVLQLSLGDAKRWGSMLIQEKRVPMLWWCSAVTAGQSAAFCEDDIRIDGILTPSMTEQELHWALHFGAKQCFERQQWLNERKQLEARIEERKWIDMAKGILCKIKNVSEAEAYDILRKQAMNDRKRMVDVATSIVKVYQILQEQK